MKKLITTWSLVLGLGLATAQQVAPQKATTVAHSKTIKTEPSKKGIQAKAVVKSEMKTTTTNSSVRMKKDGTPDKRYKANQKLKKDGTPDRRYK